MQLKYLNFYKIISQFATNIVGAFVPLLIFQATGSLVYTFIYVLCELSMRIILNACFFKLFKKYPQIMLLLRVFPVLIYSLCIFLLDYNLVLGVVLVGFFYAMSFSFKEIPMEIVFNYSSLNGTDSQSKGLGASRMFEQAGLLISIVLGGLFIEKLGKTIPIIIAIVSYLISIIPLVMYYVKEKSNPLFNKDAVSNAVEAFGDSKVKTLQEKNIKKKVLRNIFWSYFLSSAPDEVTTMFMIFLFAKNPNAYSLAGYMQATMWFAYGIGCLFTEKYADKHDLTKAFIISVCAVTALTIILPFTVIYNVPGLAILVFAIMGFFYGIISSYQINSLFAKTRIMGISNDGLYVRAMGYCTARVPGFIIAMFGISCLPFAIWACGAIHLNATYLNPRLDENNRSLIVDYLQNNKMY